MSCCDRCRTGIAQRICSDFTLADLKFQSITTDDVQVRVYGNTAVETGVSTMSGQDKGKVVPRDNRFTRVWIKQEVAGDSLPITTRY